MNSHRRYYQSGDDFDYRYLNTLVAIAEKKISNTKEALKLYVTRFQIFVPDALNRIP